MKKFFESKFNLTIVVFLGISLLGLILSLLVSVAVIVCLTALAIACFMLSIVFFKRYRKIKELKKEGVDVEGETFDVSEYGYEEDVYMVPDDNKKIIKRKLSLSIDTLAPGILCVTISIILIGMVVKMFLAL